MWVHRITEKDIEARTGVCANCGPIKLKKSGKTWRCMVAWSEHQKKCRNTAAHPHRLLKKDRCEGDCTATIVDACQLDVHHIDGDHENNDPANLQTLCSNCHRLHHFGSGS